MEKILYGNSFAFETEKRIRKMLCILLTSMVCLRLNIGPYTPQKTERLWNLSLSENSAIKLAI